MARRFPIGLTIASAIAFAILVGLGVWQVKRLHWKTALLADVAAAKTAPVRPLAEVLASSRPAWRRVSVDCPGLATAPFVELQTIVDGQPGSRLISACELPGGSILIDRGFIDAERSVRPPVSVSTVPVTVVGILREGDKGNIFTPPPSHGRFYARDLAAMAAELKAPNPKPWFIAAQNDTTPGFEALKPVPVPGDIPNRHLGYIITWFGLAGALACVYAAMLAKRLRQPRDQ
jgi:surfeit locus 1 family protein